jgi:hypothetical protein
MGMSTRSKWLDWNPGTPQASILAETTENPGQIFFENGKGELTKTPKTIFDVFVGSPLANFQKMEAEAGQHVDADETDTFPECKSGPDNPSQEQIEQAGKALAQAGVRFMELEGLVAVRPMV